MDSSIEDEHKNIVCSECKQPVDSSGWCPCVSKYEDLPMKDLIHLVMKVSDK